MKAGVIILSGGKSSRMGRNKALLPIDERPNIERIKKELEGLVDDMILVTNEPEVYEFLQLKTVSDYYPGKGPLAGIHAGLTVSVNEFNLVVACDMPFISAKLARVLLEQAADFEAVIPVIDGRQQMLFAVYTKRLIPAIEKSIEDGKLAIKHVLDSRNVFYLSEKELLDYNSERLNRIFFNMNNPEEYEFAKKLAKMED